MDQFLQDGEYGFFAIVDFVVVLLAILANCCVLSAILRCSFNLTGYRCFLISLTASDLYFCCTNLLAFIFQIAHYYASALPGSRYFMCGANMLRVMQLVGFFLNLLNLCGMSLDHFVGIVHPIKYRYLMNKNTAKRAVGAIWCISFLLVFIDIVVNLVSYHVVKLRMAEAAAAAMTPSTLPPRIQTPPTLPFIKSHRSQAELLTDLIDLFEHEDTVRRQNEAAEIDICTFQHDSKMWFECCIIILAIVCSIFLTICYSIVIKKVSSHNADVTGRGHATRKLILTTAMLIGIFLLCWIPFSVWELVMFIVFKRESGSNTFLSLFFEREQLLSKSLLVQQILNSILRTYPLVDPLIYAARIPAVQQFILLELIRKFKCCFWCSRFLSYQNRQSLTLSNIPTGTTRQFQQFSRNSSYYYGGKRGSNPVSATISIFSGNVRHENCRVSFSLVAQISNNKDGASLCDGTPLTRSLVDGLDTTGSMTAERKNKTNRNNRNSHSFRVQKPHHYDNNNKQHLMNHIHFGSSNNLSSLLAVKIDNSNSMLHKSEMAFKKENETSIISSNSFTKLKETK